MPTGPLALTLGDPAGIGPEIAPAAVDPGQWLQHHAFAASFRCLLPPGRCLAFAVGIRQVNNLVWRCNQEPGIGGADACDCFHVPDVILGDVYMALARHDVKWSQPKIIERTYRPAIPPVRFDVSNSHPEPGKILLHQRGN